MVVRDVWFTADDLEEILWLDRSQLEKWLIEDGQLTTEERHEPWAVDLPYMDRLVLNMLGRLPDQASLPHDDAASLLLRYALVLVDKRQRFPLPDSSIPSFDEVRFELQDWEDRVRPLLRRPWQALESSCASHLTSFVQVM
ncbi:MAG: hypothetical protein HY822_12730 [Acidobacteria bacterium]|nr:hypothetical protein [Acidobacteriota bacterium]